MSLEVAGLLTMAGGATAVMAAAAVADPGLNVAQIASGGAVTILATALADVARRLMNGSLVSRKVADTEEEMRKEIEAAGQREERVMRIAEEATSVPRETAAKVADELRESTAKIAANLADSTQRQMTHMSDQVAALTRGFRDLEDRIERRGGMT